MSRCPLRDMWPEMDQGTGGGLEQGSRRLTDSCYPGTGWPGDWRVGACRLLYGRSRRQAVRGGRSRIGRRQALLLNQCQLPALTIRAGLDLESGERLTVRETVVRGKRRDVLGQGLGRGRGVLFLFLGDILRGLHLGDLLIADGLAAEDVVIFGLTDGHAVH